MRSIVSAIIFELRRASSSTSPAMESELETRTLPFDHDMTTLGNQKVLQFRENVALSERALVGLPSDRLVVERVGRRS